MSTTYTLDYNGLTLRRFDSVEELDDFLAHLVWEWLGQGSTFGAEYVKDGLILTDGQGNKATFNYSVGE